MNISFCVETADRIEIDLLMRDEMALIYPGYASWVRKCRKERRRVIAAKLGRRTIGFVVLKIKNESLKLCQIYVVEEYRNQGIGKKLLLLCENEATLNNTHRMYVTVNKGNDMMESFLENNGFYPIDIAVYGDVVYEKLILPSATKQYVLMSLKPQYWDLILRGMKSLELRKVAWKNTNSNIAVYVSSPISKIAGLISIDDIDIKPIDVIRDYYLSDISITESELDGYLDKKEVATILKIKRATKFKKPIKIDVLSMQHPPQNYCYLTSEQFKRILLMGEKEYERIY